MSLLHALTVTLLTAPPPAGATRVAFVPLAATAGVDAKEATALSEVVLGSARKRPGVQVVADEEVKSLLSLEQQKQLLGCSEERCKADLGNALGVDLVLLGSVGKLGESTLLTLKLVRAKDATVRVSTTEPEPGS